MKKLRDVWAYYIKIYLHLKFTKHKLVGGELAHIDPYAYPYCEICGASPREDYTFCWFYAPHVDVRNRLLRLGQYEKK